MDGYATGWTVMQRDDRLRNRAELDIRTEHIYSVTKILRKIRATTFTLLPISLDNAILYPFANS